MATATIIQNIINLPLAEQYFVVEQVLKTISKNKYQTEDFVETQNIETASSIGIDEAFDNCFNLLSKLYGVDTRALAEQHNLL